MFWGHLSKDLKMPNGHLIIFEHLLILGKPKSLLTRHHGNKGLHLGL